MTHIHKSISSDTILSKIYRDFRPSDSRWTASALEWIGEAIQAIGYFTGFVNKSGRDCVPLQVSNFRAKIPCDVERILHVEYEGEKLFFGSDDSGYLSSKNSDSNATSSVNPDSNSNTFTGVSSSLGSGGTERVNSDRTTNIEPDPNAPFFLLNPNYIHASFETGEIKLHYIAFPVDDEGLPLIIDEYHYKECVFWYIVFKMLLSGYKHPELRLRDAKDLFEDELPRAQNAAKFPSIYSMDRLQNLWSRYTLNYRMPERFFQNAETAQYINR